MTAVEQDASQQAVIEAALVLLERMGLSPADLAAVPQPHKLVPTFAECVPVVSAAVSAGTRRAHGSYWNRVVEHWGGRRLDEPSPSEIRQLMAYVKTHVVARRNARGGRSAEEHLVAALRCLYQRAVDDGLIAEADNPARKVAKPRRLPSTRRAVPDTRLAEINEAAAATGDDPELDTLLLRLHTETACRRGGALALPAVSPGRSRRQPEASGQDRRGRREPEPGGLHAVSGQPGPRRPGTERGGIGVTRASPSSRDGPHLDLVDAEHLGQEIVRGAVVLRAEQQPVDVTLTEPDRPDVVPPRPGGLDGVVCLCLCLCRHDVPKSLPQ
jgi:hypothetical protein